MSQTECIGVVHGDRKIFIRKPTKWTEFICLVSEKFGLGREYVECCSVYMTGINLATRWELDPAAWEGVPSHAVVLFESSGERDVNPPQDELNIIVKTLTGKDILIESKQVHSCTTVVDLKRKVQEKERIPVDQQRMIYRGRQLENKRTLDYYAILPGEITHLVLALRGAKPAIYLLSPNAIDDIEISVSLRRWNFTILYPPTDKKRTPSGGDKDENMATWTVSLQKDSTMRHKETGVVSSYLFWEAEITADSFGFGDAANDSAENGVTVLTIPPIPALKFDPLNASRYIASRPTRTCTLSYDDLLPYMDKVLQELTLTPAMRTEFMVYWIPSFQRIREEGLHIKFMFVPQREFNDVARLDVNVKSKHTDGEHKDQQPKCIARIFLLFGGVMPGSDQTAVPEASAWADNIGFSAEEMRDETTFRVLEWGGMEVHGLEPRHNKADSKSLVVEDNGRK